MANCFNVNSNDHLNDIYIIDYIFVIRQHQIITTKEHNVLMMMREWWENHVWQVQIEHKQISFNKSLIQNNFISWVRNLLQLNCNKIQLIVYYK